MNLLFNKKTNFLLFKIIIVLSTYTFVVYKIYKSVESSEFTLANFSLSKIKLVILTIVFTLMMVNWLLEAAKWKILVKNIKKISLKHSLRSVLAGISIGIFTPNRIGEFAGRPYFSDSKKMVSGVFAAIVGSLSQSLITILFGILALNIYIFDKQSDTNIDKFYIYLLFVISVLLVLFLSYAFFKPVFLLKIGKKFRLLKKHEEKLQFLASYKFKDLLNILSYSFFRYAVFFTQFYLLLLFFDVKISMYHSLIAVGLIYLFLFIIPGFILSEIGVRGSLAIFFLGMYSTNYPAIFSASILLWIINLAIPAIWGTFIVMKASSKRNMENEK